VNGVRQVEPERRISRIPIGEQWMTGKEVLLRMMRNRLDCTSRDSVDDLPVGLGSKRHVNNSKEVAVRTIRISDPCDDVTAAGRLLCEQGDSRTT